MTSAMAPWPAFLAAGALIGLLTGLFGVGGSSIATPLLAVLGVPPLLAVASPLPATLPTALVGSVPYLRAHEARPRAAGWSLVGGLPAAVAGSLLSKVVGGEKLLILSGVVLVIVGVQVTRPISPAARRTGERRRRDRPVLVAAMVGVGLFTGLLANGGGFLLVPLYLLVFGLAMREAAGTSLIVIAVMSVPTLLTHWALGNIDWTVGLLFAAGAVPAGAVSSRFAHRISGSAVRRAFGWFLVASGLVFVASRLLATIA